MFTYKEPSSSSALFLKARSINTKRSIFVWWGFPALEEPLRVQCTGACVAASTEVRGKQGKGIFTSLLAKILQVKKVGNALCQKGEPQEIIWWNESGLWSINTQPSPSSVLPTGYNLFRYERAILERVVLQQNWKMYSSRNITPLCTSLPLCLLLQYANIFPLFSCTAWYVIGSFFQREWV